MDIRRWRRSRVVRFDARLVKVSNLMCSHLCFVVCSTLASISPRKPQFSTVISFIHPSYDHIINYYYFFFGLTNYHYMVSICQLLFMVSICQLLLHGIDLWTIRMTIKLLVSQEFLVWFNIDSFNHTRHTLHIRYSIWLKVCV